MTDYYPKSVSVSKEEKKFIEQNDISPTRIFRDEIQDMMDNGNPNRHVPLSELKSFRKDNLIITLLGFTILLIPLVFSGFFLLTSRVVLVVLYISGALTAVYGASQLRYWNDLISQRARIKEQQEEAGENGESG